MVSTHWSSLTPMFEPGSGEVPGCGIHSLVESDGVSDLSSAGAADGRAPLPRHPLGHGDRRDAARLGAHHVTERAAPLGGRLLQQVLHHLRGLTAP